MRRAWAVLIGLVLLAAGCGGDAGGGGAQDSGEPPEEPVLIRMGWISSVPGNLGMSLMSTNPELTPNRGTWYELEFSDFPGAPAIVQGMATGSLDAGTVGSLDGAAGLDQGADFVLTAGYVDEREGWGSSSWLVRKGEIASAADLRNGTVAVNQVGGYPDYIADHWLREEGGLEPNRDYEKVQIPFPEMGDALAAGQADLIVVPATFVPGLLANGEFEVLFRAIDVLDPMSLTVQAFSREFVEENRAVVQKFLEDYQAVAQFMAEPENRDVAIESFVETSGQPLEFVDPVVLTRNDLYRAPDGAIDVGVLQGTWDFFREQGAFRARLEVEDYIIPGVSLVTGES
jgi:ABC-type nitrate/sulfonate/bicarbonate transport system substrate-binding protein